MLTRTDWVDRPVSLAVPARAGSGRRAPATRAGRWPRTPRRAEDQQRSNQSRNQRQRFMQYPPRAAGTSILPRWPGTRRRGPGRAVVQRPVREQCGIDPCGVQHHQRASFLVAEFGGVARSGRDRSMSESAVRPARDASGPANGIDGTPAPSTVSPNSTPCCSATLARDAAMVMARSSRSSALTPEPASNRVPPARERSTTTRTRGEHDMGAG